jgi:hypothetical protein
MWSRIASGKSGASAHRQGFSQTRFCAVTQQAKVEPIYTVTQQAKVEPIYTVSQ